MRLISSQSYQSHMRNEGVLVFSEEHQRLIRLGRCPGWYKCLFISVFCWFKMIESFQVNTSILGFWCQFSKGSMRRSRKFCQRRSNHDNFFLVYEGWVDPNSTISSPSSAHQQNDITMALWNGVLLTCWWWPNIECWLGSFVIIRGSGPELLRNPICFVIFQGGPLYPPPLDPQIGS